jgi:hypothetical protein
MEMVKYSLVSSGALLDSNGLHKSNVESCFVHYKGHTKLQLLGLMFIL